jgi:hypothetical protein
LAAATDTKSFDSSGIELNEVPDIGVPHEAFPIPAPKTVNGSTFEESQAQQPRRNGFRKPALAGGGLTIAAMAVFGIGISRQHISLAHRAAITDHKSAGSSVDVAGLESKDTRNLTNQSKLLDQARSFSQKREYRRAGDIYRSILKSDPTNFEVKHLLASALFRQEKIEESVIVLNSISEDQGNAAQASASPQ